ncbi:MAG: hypothetical protein LBS34_03095 [Rickettsiales bacterium]|jgi:pantetheine-phosphate adenylyltransferase|nr:hypothetical protein [Rickettsiales bacterium]
MKAIVTTSANPFHHGHLSLYREAGRVFGEGNVRVAIGKNFSKNVDFNRIIYHLTPYKIKYDITENITLSDYCRDNKVDYIVRGIRNAVDAEYELKLDFLNKEINEKLQTMFFPTKDIFSNISSTSINELLKYNKYDIVKKYMNEDAMYRFAHKYPEFIIFFGKSCIGKTYYLENTIFKGKNTVKVDEIFWDIFQECYGRKLRIKVEDESRKLVYNGKSLDQLVKKYSTVEYWQAFFSHIRSNCEKYRIDENIIDFEVEDRVYLLDFAHIGVYWSTIPPQLRGALYLVNMKNSTKNRNEYINEKNFRNKVNYLDDNYKEPYYYDKIINLRDEQL